MLGLSLSEVCRPTRDGGSKNLSNPTVFCEKWIAIWAVTNFFLVKVGLAARSERVGEKRPGRPLRHQNGTRKIRTYLVGGRPEGGHSYSSYSREDVGPNLPATPLNVAAGAEQKKKKGVRIWFV